MNVYGLVTVGLVVASGMACSKSKSSSSTSEESIESVNGLAVAYPNSLALSVFPTSTTTLALNEDATAEQIVDRPPAEKIAENEKMLKGDGSVECFPKGLFAPPPKLAEITCYQFDNDMNPSTVNGKTFGTKDGKHTDGEACMVAFARAEANVAVDRLEKIQAIVKGMLCQAKKDGVDTTPPEEGVEKDLKASMANAAGKTMPVTKAMMKGLVIDGKPAYQVDVTMKDPRGHEMEVHLVNQKVLDEDGTEIGDVGRMWSKRPAKAGFREGVKKDDNNSINKMELLSISYDINTVDKNQRVTVQRAAVVNSVKQMFTAEGAINFADISKDADRSTIHDINFVSFDMDPDTAEGTMSYWQNPGPTYDESARGFLFSSTVKDGKLSGCGVSGATADISIRKALLEPSETNVLKPVRYYHPFAVQNINTDKDPRYNNTDKGPLVTKQCFVQSDDGVYEIDTAETSHERGYDVVAIAKMGMEPPRAPVKKLEIGTALR